MAWLLRPPDTVKSGEPFSVSYSVSAGEAFYRWAVENHIFTHSAIVDADAARRFCENIDCPTNWKDADGENCCIHHANIHSCPLGHMTESICGPWIPDDGKIFTHTISTAGKMTQSNWTSKVVLVHSGLTSLIAHIRVGRMQVALEAKSTVEAGCSVWRWRLVRRRSFVSTCSADCGECPMTPTTKLSIGLPLSLLCLCFVLTAVWLRYQKQKLLWDESWIIDFSKIKQDQEARMTMGSPDECADRKSNKSGSSTTRTCASFIGGCVEPPDVAIVTEYCPKGSLNDVLLNEEIPLNWGFRFSFATDIARGVAYLHQHKICHGRLKSVNCVIDDRWVCKITGTRGRSLFRPISRDFRRSTCRPEFHNSSMEPTLAADVFSYSIILLEIATRSDPVPVEESSLESSWCPPLPELISSQDYVELIRRCRSQNPFHRPTFEQIKKFVNRVNPIKVSPVDMMMNLMEKYSKHLEVLVAERTQDLTHEKQKTDRLLYSMLPRQVADDLRQGKPLKAQSYVSATVFFSDIVGFTQLSSSSTPYQIVDFLNKLYTTFDDIIDNYDVYKVETIGDAYMVVSGVPQENGVQHAAEISSLALDLVGVCSCFRIPHTHTLLQIRAGIHSGPVVAGVVGTKMPRYCLFGDTVNTASRMESTSL
ncbi:hypothetical protein JOQ06_013775, partial [Pogonophryne albipinna]